MDAWRVCPVSGKSKQPHQEIGPKEFYICASTAMVLLGKHTENLCFSRQIYPFLKGPDVGFSILGARFEDAQFWGARGPKFPICFYVQYQYPVLSHVKYPCYFKPFLKLDPYVKPTIKNIFLN